MTFHTRERFRNPFFFAMAPRVRDVDVVAVIAERDDVEQFDIRPARIDRLLLPGRNKKLCRIGTGHCRKRCRQVALFNLGYIGNLSRAGGFHQ